jgi:hypothetical protein
MPAPHDHTQARETSVSVRLIRVSLVMLGIAAGVVAAVAGGAISLPSFGGGAQARVSSTAALAAQREAADSQWAAATCTNLLDWKKEVERDGTSLDLGFGPSARINDAIAATRRMLAELDKLGLPPAAQNARAQAQIEQLRSDLQSRLDAIEGTASSVASGNVLAIGTLVGDLASDKVIGSQLASELGHVVSVDLGLSLAETRACRELVGIPV